MIDDPSTPISCSGCCSAQTSIHFIPPPPLPPSPNSRLNYWRHDGHIYDSATPKQKTSARRFQSAIQSSKRTSTRQMEMKRGNSSNSNNNNNNNSSENGSIKALLQSSVGNGRRWRRWRRRSHFNRNGRRFSETRYTDSGHYIGRLITKNHEESRCTPTTPPLSTPHPPPPPPALMSQR